MVSSIDKIRELFDDEIRAAEGTLKALETNISAAQLRLTETSTKKKKRCLDLTP